jgi:hypothetical protein
MPLTDGGVGLAVGKPDAFAPGSAGFILSSSEDPPITNVDRSEIMSVQYPRNPGEVTIYVTVVLGMLFPSPPGKISVQPGIPNQPFEFPNHPMLGPAGAAGWDRLRHTTPTLFPSGDWFWAERVGDALPKLVGIWVPTWMTLASKQPINYFLYFPPPPHPDKGAVSSWGDYPYGRAPDGKFRYLLLGYRYLLDERRTGYHIQRTAKKVIGVVPIGKENEPFVSFATPSGVYRLLREVNLFLHKRKRRALLDFWVPQPVGKVGLAGFSESGTFLHTAILPTHDPMGKEFYDKKLTEVYCLDPGQEYGLSAAVHDWFRGGDNERRFRVYSHWYDMFGDGCILYSDCKGHASPVAYGAGKASEVHRPDGRCSIVRFNDQFFDGIDLGPEEKAGHDIHHFMPRYCLGHAFQLSGLD